MTSICLYFQVHQPFRLKNYSFSAIGQDHRYEDEYQNKKILDRVAFRCYLPVNQLLLELIKKYEGKLKIAFSISGTAIEQFERYRPDILLSFNQLNQTGCVEFLAETYYHSLAFVYSPLEFERQVHLHSQKIEQYFGKKPSVFRNTELIYNNLLGNKIEQLGFKGVICEGAEKVLKGKSPNVLYKAKDTDFLRVLTKNYKLSDDIAFRFSDETWEHKGFSPETFIRWINESDKNTETINLFMDYETFGEHHAKETGIIDFLENFIHKTLESKEFQFKSPTELINQSVVLSEYDTPEYISWADSERDLSAWADNNMQKETLKKIYSLENKVKQTNDKNLLDTWAKLQTSDHFYYMSTKYFHDKVVHQYFSHYETPFDAYINYMNILSDFETRL